ncbi:uncharacterized protein LOC106775409 [Vigna radiata var. radiata]|uniref:Uncharacterized protein LOC106775409 n=1 Tax=Vigna radiata var. radiata TaxID=3916 RepID=A0A1S3VIU1_VIGRR|nr:uncharacterized protein LOC106775409 [Vigna radiata var. radiata]
MEAVGSRLSRASSRYGASTVFTGPVRKWKKKWVHVTPSSSVSNTTATTNNNGHSHANSNSSSRLLLRRWTPTTADDAAGVSDEPPRRKFRYTPIAVLEEQKRMMVVKKENEPATGSDQSAVKQTNITHEKQGKFNMNEILEETKDSNIVKLDHGLDLQSNNDETSLNSDTQLETNI